MTKINDELPEKFTQAQAREANKKYWDQPHASRDEFAGCSYTPRPIETRNNPNAVPVPPPVGGTGPAAISRETSERFAQSGPLAEGPKNYAEKNVTLAEQSGLRPNKVGE